MPRPLRRRPSPPSRVCATRAVSRRGSESSSSVRVEASGRFAVQLAKHFGANVTGVCSTSKVDWSGRWARADDVVDYTRSDVGDGSRRYDLVLDTAGHRPLRQLRRALTPNGRLVIVASEVDGRWLGGVDRNLRAALLSPFVGQRLRVLLSKEHPKDHDLLRALIETRKLTPVVDRTFPRHRPVASCAQAGHPALAGQSLFHLPVAARPAECRASSLGC
jgi:NADPH:quinone reductase-like Zn-dependent oxidoreductase